MIHLEVRNKPPALGGEEFIYRNIECLAFDYNETKRSLAIFETEKEWADNTPAYSFCYVTRVTYWDDNKED